MKNFENFHLFLSSSFRCSAFDVNICDAYTGRTWLSENFDKNINNNIIKTVLNFPGLNLYQYDYDLITVHDRIEGVCMTYMKTVYMRVLRGCCPAEKDMVPTMTCPKDGYISKLWIIVDKKTYCFSYPYKNTNTSIYECVNRHIIRVEDKNIILPQIIHAHKLSNVIFKIEKIPYDFQCEAILYRLVY